MVRYLSSLICLMVYFFHTGCSTSKQPTLNPHYLPKTVPAILSFLVDGLKTGKTISANTSVILSWSSENSVDCKLKDLTGSTLVTGLSHLGFSTPPLTSSTEFTLECKGNEETVRSTINVNLVSAPNVSILAEGLPRITIAYEGSAKLSWSSTGTACSLFIINASENKEMSTLISAKDVSTGPLTQETTYRLTCKNALGVSAIATTIVSVNPRPTVTGSITLDGATEKTLPNGGSATLKWSATNTTSCSVRNPSGQEISTNPIENVGISTGALSVSGIFSLTCIGIDSQTYVFKASAVVSPPPDKPPVFQCVDTSILPGHTGNQTCSATGKTCVKVLSISGRASYYCDTSVANTEWMSRCCSHFQNSKESNIATVELDVPLGSTGDLTCNKANGSCIDVLGYKGERSLYCSTEVNLPLKNEQTWKIKCFAAASQASCGFETVPIGSTGDQVCAALGKTCMNVIGSSGFQSLYCAMNPISGDNVQNNFWVTRCCSPL